jgi:hypothetical protein
VTALEPGSLQFRRVTSGPRVPSIRQIGGHAAVPGFRLATSPRRCTKAGLRKTVFAHCPVPSLPGSQHSRERFPQSPHPQPGLPTTNNGLPHLPHYNGVCQHLWSPTTHGRQGPTLPSGMLLAFPTQATNHGPVERFPQPQHAGPRLPTTDYTSCSTCPTTRVFVNTCGFPRPAESKSAGRRVEPMLHCAQSQSSAAKEPIPYSSGSCLHTGQSTARRPCWSGPFWRAFGSCRSNPLW